MSLLSSVLCAYDNFFVFGDSLSDVGNAPNTRDLNFEGRWSNGNVWAEYLASMLGLAPATKSSDYSAGDTFATNNINFAYGGAMTSFGTTSATGIPSIDEQIFGKKNALGHVTDIDKGFARYDLDFGENDLVSIWAGANNLFFTVTITDYEVMALQAASDMYTNIENLILKGAKNLLILNLPDIGNTPCYKNDEEGKANASLFSTTFNAALFENVELLKIANPDTDFIYIDMYAIFNDLLYNPLAYGFEIVDTSLISVYDNGHLPTDEESSKYLFYDDVHPTTAGHQMLATLIYSQIPEPAHYALFFGFIALAFALYRKRRLR